MIRIPPVSFRRNPLVGFERRPWERTQRNRAESLFMSPKYEQMWEKALRNTDIKFRIFVTRQSINEHDDPDTWRMLYHQAKKNNEVVLLLAPSGTFNDLPYVFADYRDDPDPTKKGDPMHVSLPTPFMILHNLYEYMERTVKEYMAAKGMRSWDGPTDLLAIDTWAGRRGILLDESNGMADLFAKYIITGRVAYTGPDYAQVKQMIEQATQYLRDHPGLYTFSIADSVPATGGE